MRRVVEQVAGQVSLHGGELGGARALLGLAIKYQICCLSTAAKVAQQCVIFM